MRHHASWPMTGVQNTSLKNSTYVLQHSLLEQILETGLGIPVFQAFSHSIHPFQTQL